MYVCTLQFVFRPDHLGLWDLFGGSACKRYGLLAKGAVKISEDFSIILRRPHQRLENIPKVSEDNGGLSSFDQAK